MSPVALLALLLLPAAAQPQGEEAWPVDQTQHFTVHHERAGAALGDYNLIERVYEALHPSLWTLAPWMATDKTQVYLYKGPDTYAAGRFKPPPWSGGLLQTTEDEKDLAIFEPVDASIVAHELTHLYFHSFFDGKGSPAPAWLDEGLASMLQNDALSLPDPRQKGPILRSPVPLAQFFKSSPGRDAPGAWVGAWYQQAQSVVWFLKRGHADSSFTDFCGKLRDGEDLEAALRESYGYADLGAFEDDWRRWRPKRPVGSPNDLQGQ